MDGEGEAAHGGAGVLRGTGDHWRQSKAKLDLATRNMKILETI